MLIELLKHSVDAAPAGFGGCVDAGSRQMVWRVARSPRATRPFTTLCRGPSIPHNSGERSPGFRLGADRAGACMRQGAAEQIASEAARAAARAEPNSVQNLLKYQLPVSTIGGEGGIRTPDRLAPMPHFECGAFDHSATSPGAITGDSAPIGRGEF